MSLFVDCRISNTFFVVLGMRRRYTFVKTHENPILCVIIIKLSGLAIAKILNTHHSRNSHFRGHNRKSLIPDLLRKMCKLTVISFSFFLSLVGRRSRCAIDIGNIIKMNWKISLEKCKTPIDTHNKNSYFVYFRLCRSHSDGFHSSKPNPLSDYTHNTNT